MKYLIYSAIGLSLTILVFGSSKRYLLKKEVVSSTPIVRTIEAVAALGQLSPSGEVRILAAPITGFGGSPRIEKLLIKEGDEVKAGDVIAVFDNQAILFVDLEILQARLLTLNKKITAQEREVNRYEQSVSFGGSPEILLDGKKDNLDQFLGQRKELLGEIKALKIDLSKSELKSPINGIILKINSREGERPGEGGVVEVGSSQNMEALIEVYESDINRVYIGQNVSLTSENGGFDGILQGKVSQISPQVSQRRVLAIDPTGDADARVVEVRITLSLQSSLKVNRFTGMKVIARFKPQ